MRIALLNIKPLNVSYFYFLPKKLLNVVKNIYLLKQFRSIYFDNMGQTHGIFGMFVENFASETHFYRPHAKTQNGAKISMKLYNSITLLFYQIKP